MVHLSIRRNIHILQSVWILPTIVLRSHTGLLYRAQSRRSQSTWNLGQNSEHVTLRRVVETMVAVEKQQYYILVCVCMLTRACVHMGARVREHLYAHT